MAPEADQLPPTERLAALDMAIADLEQPEQTRRNDSLGGAPRHSTASVTCLYRSTAYLVQVISAPSPEWFAALRTTAHSPAGLTAANLTMDERGLHSCCT